MRDSIPIPNALCIKYNISKLIVFHWSYHFIAMRICDKEYEEAKILEYSILFNLQNAHNIGIDCILSISIISIFRIGSN